MVIDGQAAWANLLRSTASRWTAAPNAAAVHDTAHARLESGLAVAGADPAFALNANDAFFCIGSCFARNIEEHLMYRGITTLSKAIALRGGTGRPNAGVNKFTTGSMLNELRWALLGEPWPQTALVDHDGGWRDLQLSPRAVAIAHGDACARRERVVSYFRRVRDASVIIITLGLVETWFDAESGLALNVAPPLAVVRRYPGRFGMRVCDYAENRAALEAIYDIVESSARPGVRIVVTVSPVPLEHTFSGEDVIVANAYGKATLLAAARDSARGRPLVQYYPSYETITVSHRSLAYSAADNHHVRDDAVGAITSHFLRTYGITCEPLFPDFVEMEYLVANPDVHDAVLDERFESGFAHWLAHGRAEGRPIRPAQRTPVLDRLLGPPQEA